MSSWVAAMTIMPFPLISLSVLSPNGGSSQNGQTGGTWRHSLSLPYSKFHALLIVSTDWQL